MTHYQFFWLLLSCSCAYGLIRGGAPERIAATTLASGCLLSIVAMAFEHDRFGHVEWGVLFVDAAMLVVFIRLAMRSTRYWPMWITAVQIIEVATHFTRPFPGVISTAYTLSLMVLAYPHPVLLVIATYRHDWRKQHLGRDPDWIGEMRAS